MLTITDLFCGAGGSSQGAEAIDGVAVQMAANHWDLAIQSHQSNFPHVDHDCADISQVEPRRYRRTDILWASPECTNHSGAKGLPSSISSGQTALWGGPDPAAERSRATMWDVARFAEVHRYRAIVVENVVEAANWVMWDAWLMALAALGYEHQVVFLNSMHAPAQKAPRAPQSRDRMYVVFHRRGNQAPDVELRPVAPCESCGVDVRAVQVFKTPKRWGRYRAQYVYRCPQAGCHRDVEPYAVPAAEAIDWTLPAERIGARARPLSEKTLRRIQIGIDRFTGPQLVPAGGTWNDESQPVTRPFRARTTRETEGLMVPPMPPRAAVGDGALVVPYYSNGIARPASEPLPTLTTVDRHALAFVAELRGGGSTARSVAQPLSTVTASGNHHMLVDVPEPSPVTHKQTPMIDDCQFRMLQPPEVAGAMAFQPDYVVLGTKREQIRQLGNAVTPPAAEYLLRAVAATLR